MTPYIHKVQYYETDKMGITHHSNYIRWMEEARVAYLEQIGWSYDKLEREGIISPVLSVDCKYKETTTFPDEIQIHVTLLSFGPVRMTIFYEMINTKTGNVVCTATTEHCFLNDKGNPIRLKKDYPEFYQTMSDLVAPKTNI